MAAVVVITGAAGNVGAKLRAHLTRLGGYELRLLDIDPRGDPEILQADLSRPDQGWSDLLIGADVVVHLAANADSGADWRDLIAPNVDAVLNLYLAAARHRTPKLVLASSVWAMAAHHARGLPIPAGEPDPAGNAYGATKLFGERIAHAFWTSHGVKTVVLRLGGCRPGANPPGPGPTAIEEFCWISNGDTCRGFELAIKAEPEGVAVVNLVSDNPGGGWSLQEARDHLGYAPQDRGCISPPPQATPALWRRALHRLHGYV